MKNFYYINAKKIFEKNIEKILRKIKDILKFYYYLKIINKVNLIKILLEKIKKYIYN